MSSETLNRSGAEIANFQETESVLNHAFFYVLYCEERKGGNRTKPSTWSHIRDFLKRLKKAFLLPQLWTFFIHYPFINLSAFLRGTTQGTRDGDRALTLLVLLSLSTMYGLLSALRGYGFNLALITTGDSYLVVARQSGVLVTFFFLAGLVAMFRPLNSCLSEISFTSLNWRRIHINLMYLSGIFAAIHSIAHGLRRIFHPSLPVDYEAYFLATGVVLWVLFISQYIPFFLITLLRDRYAPSWVKWAKWWFRFSHTTAFPIIAVVYLAHSASFFPLALFTAWYYIQKSCELPLTNMEYSIENFETVGEKTDSQYDLVLTCECEKTVADDFGYYCQVSLLGLSSSYTMVGAPQLTNQQSANIYDKHSSSATLKPLIKDAARALQFRIKRCDLTDNLEAYRIMHPSEFLDVTTSKDRVRNVSTYRTVDPVTTFRNLDLKIHGPYHSTHMSIRSGRRDLIVFVNKNSISVAESAVQFYRQKPGYFTSVFVLLLWGRTRAALEGRADLAADQARAYVLRPVVYNGEVGRDGEPADEKVKSLVQLIENTHTRSYPEPGFKADVVHVYGEFTQAHTEQVLKAKESAAPDKRPHFLICNSIVAGHVDNLKPAQELRERIHVEVFGI